ncbi:MAG: Ppx/GppA family phosphatase, partial [Candidatus Eremiobacteraeota bacterium]|nr:Ppx/GppA family phosphatase [Candidatus Eremiobacteraeota bacterium]
ARAEIAAIVAPLRELGSIAELRCVAGTPLTIAAIVAESHVGLVSGTRLSHVALDATIDRLLALTLEERRALPGMLPQRADVLAGGALIVSEAMSALGVTEGLLEANDLLLGYLLMQREGAGTE